MRPRTILRPGLILVLTLACLACAPPDPLEKLKRELAAFPQYSVVLEDMKEGGNLTDDFYHQYRVVWAEEEGEATPEAEPGAASEAAELAFHERLEDWAPVSEDMYRKYQDFLGMTVLAKSAEGVETTPAPAGYEYVGNPRYGEWRTDSSGNSFWAFYGRYALLSHLFGTFRQPVYRGDWSDYRSARSSGRPYFGRSQQYGTQGSYTRNTHRSFFDRQQARQQAQRQRFSDKVQQRVKRSRMSGTRSRSSSRGGK